MIPNSGNSLQFRKLLLALSMQNELTYIGPESVGPHYTESGKRPAMGEYKSAHVIAQEGDGNVLAVHYDGTNDRFSTYYADNTVRPVCWWHLPAAAPSTEREWFDKAAPDLGYGVKKHNVDGIQYSAFFGDYDFPDWEEVLREDADDCIEDCYTHWREAGRP